MSLEQFGTLVFVRTLHPPYWDMETYGLHSDYYTIDAEWSAQLQDYTFVSDITVYSKETDLIFFVAIHYYFGNAYTTYYVVSNRYLITIPNGTGYGGDYGAWTTYEEAWDWYQTLNPGYNLNLINGASQVTGIKTIIV